MKNQNEGLSKDWQFLIQISENFEWDSLLLITLQCDDPQEISDHNTIKSSFRSSASEEIHGD